MGNETVGASRVKKKKPRLEIGELDPGRDILELSARRLLVQAQAVEEEVGGLGEPERLGQTEKVLSENKRISSDIRGRERQKKEDMK